MKSDIDKNEWIEDYLNGELSPENEAEILAQIQEDPQFVQQVALHREMHELVIDKALIDVKRELGNIHSNKIKFNKNIRNYGFGIGGISIIVGIALFFFSKSRNIQDVSPKQNTVLIDSIQEDLKKYSENDQIEYINTDVKNKTQVNRSENHLSNNEIKPITHDLKQETENIKQETVNMKSETDKQETGNRKQETKNTDQLSRNETVNFLPQKDPCLGIKISAVITTSESCNNNATGSIIIDAESVSGGLAPYQYSINKTLFTDSSHLHKLTSGAYNIYIKDAANCIVKVAKVWIESVDCSYQAVFSPRLGETWGIPVKDGKNGEIRIFNKSGNIVFKETITPGFRQEWKGTNSSQQILPMGIYQFVITYTDGDVFSGNVTILK